MRKPHELPEHVVVMLILGAISLVALIGWLISASL